MAKNIVTIGLSLAGNAVTNKAFSSKASLLDFDIILFRPDISTFLSGAGESRYNGKRCLGDEASFKLKESCEHWRREIKEAFNGGKTVIVFLSELVEVFIDTGRREHSGTGRNRQETRIVDHYSNFKSLPISEKVTATNGSSMKLAQSSTGLLSQYWLHFQALSKYNVIFSESKKVCIETKSGEKPVGLLYLSEVSGGSLLLLPDIDFNKREFFGSNGTAFSKAAHEFAGLLLQQVVALEKALRSASDLTPEPTWVSLPEYVTKPEAEARQKLLLAEEEVTEAQRKKEMVEDELQQAGKLKRLVYEGGKALEEAIIESLIVLGYNANSYRDSQSEFDVVFESDEGRLIAEAEGKDNKAVNIDKLRQLSLNVHEYLQLESVSVPAKGVLFGNGYRLVDPKDRPSQFTEKCVVAAKSTGIALVETTKLHSVAKYVSESGDESYSRLCREILASESGIIDFPPRNPSEGAVEAVVTRSEDVFN